MDFDKTLEDEPFLSGSEGSADGLRPLKQKRFLWSDTHKHNVVFLVANVIFLLANVALMAMTIMHFNQETNFQLLGSHVQDPYCE